MTENGVYRQIFATIVASMSILISGMWLGWPSAVVEKFIRHEAGDLHVDTDQLSWIVAIMDLGNVISPLFAGYLMDRIGRKPSVALLGPLFIVSWLLALFVPTTWALYTARLMAGLGKGMSYTVVPVFLGEIAGVRVRGALGSVFIIQLHGGILVETIIGPLFSYWVLNAVSAVVPVVFFIMVLWVPESPYYLLKIGRRAEAGRCLQWYRGGENVDTELAQMETNVAHDMENKATFSELFSNQKNVRALSVVVTSCVAQRAGGISCLLAYSPLLLPEPAPLMAKSQYVMLFAVLMVVTNFIGLALVDRVGRKPLLIASEASLGTISLLFAVYFYFGAVHVDANHNALTWLPYACHFAFAFMYGVGVGFIPVVLLGEMFPVNVRSYCSALASITLAFCSFVTNKIFLLVSDHFGYYAMFAVFAAVNFVCTALACMYAVETNGKTFQEIQDILKEAVSKRENKRVENNTNDAI